MMTRRAFVLAAAGTLAAGGAAAGEPSEAYQAQIRRLAAKKLWASYEARLRALWARESRYAECRKCRYLYDIARKRAASASLAEAVRVIEEGGGENRHRRAQERAYAAERAEAGRVHNKCAVCSTCVGRRAREEREEDERRREETESPRYSGK